MFVTCFKKSKLLCYYVLLRLNAVCIPKYLIYNYNIKFIILSLVGKESRGYNNSLMKFNGQLTELTRPSGLPKNALYPFLHSGKV